MNNDEIEAIGKLARSILAWGTQNKHSIYAARLVQQLAQGTLDLIEEIKRLNDLLEILANVQK